MNKWYSETPLRKKLVMIFLLSAAVVLLINVFLWRNVDQMISKIDRVYGSNVSLSDLQQGLDEVQSSMKKYLDNKTSESMEAYYSAQEAYDSLIGALNTRTTNNESRLMEKNIFNISRTYLDVTEQAVDAKRSRNVEKYRMEYEKAVRLSAYIQTCIYSLNNEQFKNNTKQYSLLTKTLRLSEYVDVVLLAVILGLELLIIYWSCRQLTEPLAMIEGADRSYRYIQNVADFFRYNLKNREEVSLRRRIRRRTRTHAEDTDCGR